MVSKAEPKAAAELKRLGEQVVEASAAAAGVPYCIGRIFSFYHPTQTGSFLYPSLQRRFATEDLTKPFRLFGAEDVKLRTLTDAAGRYRSYKIVDPSFHNWAGLAQALRGLDLPAAAPR